MSDYIGTREQVDEYVGSRLVEAAYLGSRKYYDAYSEVSGSLPLVYESRIEHILKNYALYGTASGAGVETKNLFDKDARDTSKGFVENVRIRADGTFQSYTGSNVTEYIPITPGTNYYIWPGATLNLFGDEIYDANKVRVRGAEYRLREYVGFTAQDGEAYVRFTYWAANDFKTALYEGSNSTSFIPHGYQIPLTNTGENSQSSTYPLYIGSTQLGEEEYLDYESGKVYKRTEQLYDKDNDHIVRLYPSNAQREIIASSATRSVWIECKPSTTYSIIKSVSDRFRVATTAVVPASGVTCSEVTIDDSATSMTVTTAADAAYLLIYFTSNATASAIQNLRSSLVITETSTAPSSYIPYLNPTDPPVPFPEINTYQGENTLSSTETVGEVTIKGRINELPT